MHPIFFKFHGITIYSYGFCVALAVTLALLICVRRAPKHYLSASTAIDLLFVSFVAGVMGARIFYVLQHLADYRAHWNSVFWLQEGGLVWYGGFIFAVLAGFFYCHWHRLSALAWADFFAPVLALGHGVGRVGCFLNGCCYGRQGHPTQLYEASGLFVLAVFLFLMASKKLRAGEITGCYLVLYSALRFGVEFFRGDQSLVFYLSIPQWISLGFFAFGLGFLRTLRSGTHENDR